MRVHRKKNIHKKYKAAATAAAVAVFFSHSFHSLFKYEKEKKNRKQIFKKNIMKNRLASRA